MTSLTITLEDELVERLRQRAERRGITIEAVVVEAIRRRFILDRVLRPVREAFAASGMTEDEAGDLFEAERKAAAAESLALLRKWSDEDATDDPAELRRREEEAEELLRAVEASPLRLREADPATDEYD